MYFISEKYTFAALIYSYVVIFASLNDTIFGTVTQILLIVRKEDEYEMSFLLLLLITLTEDEEEVNCNADLPIPFIHS